MFNISHHCSRSIKNVILNRVLQDRLVGFEEVMENLDAFDCVRMAPLFYGPRFECPRFNTEQATNCVFRVLTALSPPHTQELISCWRQVPPMP